MIGDLLCDAIGVQPVLGKLCLLLLMRNVCSFKFVSGGSELQGQAEDLLELSMARNCHHPFYSSSSLNALWLRRGCSRHAAFKSRCRSLVSHRAILQALAVARATRNLASIGLSLSYPQYCTWKSVTVCVVCKEYPEPLTLCGTRGSRLIEPMSCTFAQAGK